MIEDHVAAAGNVDRTLPVLSRRQTLTKAHVPYDDIRGSGERDLIVFRCDAVTGSGLAREGQVVPNAHRGSQLDVATHVEHDDSGPTADGVPKRPGSRVIQVRDVVHVAASSARRQGAKPLSSG